MLRVDGRGYHASVTQIVVPGARRAPALALALLIAAGSVVALPGRAFAQDNAHNIPGVPLPSSTVSGLLGGPIYDVVYRVTVPAAHVLVISMTGTAGTDFDLYLFDASATNIYADPPVGLVKSSTGPTSTESLDYATIGGGTFYIDLSGATNVEGTYHLVVQILPDTEPPRVTLSLDGGAPATNNPAVTATVVATDNLSGVATMQFSEDGVSWGAPEPYMPTVSWTFSGPDGPRTLWVRVTDRAGNVSSPAHASIVLDRVPPTVLARSPAAGATVAGLQPVFSVQFSEPIKVSTWTNVGLILQDASGTIVYGSYGYDPGTYTGTFMPAVPLQPGEPYVVSLGSVTDLAGNQVPPLGSWTVTPLFGTALSLTGSARVVPRGNAVALMGQMAPVLGGSLILEEAVGSGPFLPLVPLGTAPDGRYSWLAPVGSNSWFRVHYGGSAVAAEAFSPTVRVLVRRQVALEGVNAAVTRRVVAGTRVALTAVVDPTDPPVPVTLSIYRYVPGRGYVLATAVTRTTLGGRYTFSWHPGRGAYYLRLTTPPTPLFANGFSPAYRWVGY